jgi:hypothetical protein
MEATQIAYVAGFMIGRCGFGLNKAGWKWFYFRTLDPEIARGARDEWGGGCPGEDRQRRPERTSRGAGGVHTGVEALGRATSGARAPGRRGADRRPLGAAVSRAGGEPWVNKS